MIISLNSIEILWLDANNDPIQIQNTTQLREAAYLNKKYGWAVFSVQV